MSAPDSTDVQSGIRHAVIPAAGLGTRLRPLSNAFPKEMLPIGRKPVLEHILNELADAGITHVLFVISERKPQIRSYFGERFVSDSAGEIECEYVTQPEQKGLGDAILCAESWVGEGSFVVAFGDCLIDAPEPSGPLRRLMAVHTRHSAGATVVVERVPWERVSRYGVLAPAQPVAAESVEPFAAENIVEKPDRADAPSNLVVAARYVLHSDIFSFLRSAALDARGEINVTDSVRSLIHSGRRLWAVPLQPAEARRDIGSFETFFVAFARAALRDPDFGPAVRAAVEAELRRHEQP